MARTRTRRRARTKTRVIKGRAGRKPIRFKQGTLHSQMRIPQGQKIGRTRLQAAARSKNKLMAKRARFALNVLKAGSRKRSGTRRRKRR